MVSTIDQARVLVNQPTRTPLPFGLMSVAQMPPITDVHESGGVRYEVDPCGPANITTEACLATGGPTKTPTDTWMWRGATPFTVYTYPVCGPVGNWDEYQRRAVAALTNGEARAVEREFESGSLGTYPHLAANAVVSGTGFDTNVVYQTEATVVTGSPVNLVRGIAELEAVLAACYGNEGVIHIPPQVVAYGITNGTFRVDGNRLRSPSGHLIAAGAGYRGLSPAGAVQSTMTPYLYATGAVFIRRGEIQVPASNRQSLDRSVNDVHLLAERTYVIGWDCCHYAQQVDLTL